MKVLPAVKNPPRIEPDRDFTDPRNFVGPEGDRIYKQGPCQRCACLIYGDEPVVKPYCEPCEEKKKK